MYIAHSHKLNLFFARRKHRMYWDVYSLLMRSTIRLLVSQSVTVIWVYVWDVCMCESVSVYLCCYVFWYSYSYTHICMYVHIFRCFFLPIRYAYIRLLPRYEYHLRRLTLCYLQGRGCVLGVSTYHIKSMCLCVNVCVYVYVYVFILLPFVQFFNFFIIHIRTCIHTRIRT